MQYVKTLLYLLTIVITDPYASINYGDIDVYTFTVTYHDSNTIVYEGDGEAESYPYYDETENEETEYQEVEQLGPYYNPSELYNTSPKSEVYYYQKLFDYYNK